MRISAPPFLNPCYYGRDIDSREMLIAANHPIDEVCKIIGADSLGYLSVENVQKLAEHGGGFCTACFSGSYPTDVPENTPKYRFERKLSEKEPKT